MSNYSSRVDAGSPAAQAPRISALSSLPLAFLVVTVLNALYILLVAIGNVTDYGTNLAFVQHVLAMDTTNFGAAPGTELDPDVMWRAITSPTEQTIAYLGFIVWEAGAALGLPV